MPKWQPGDVFTVPGFDTEHTIIEKCCGGDSRSDGAWHIEPNFLSGKHYAVESANWVLVRPADGIRVGDRIAIRPGSDVQATVIGDAGKFWSVQGDGQFCPVSWAKSECRFVSRPEPTAESAPDPRDAEIAELKRIVAMKDETNAGLCASYGQYVLDHQQRENELMQKAVMLKQSIAALESELADRDRDCAAFCKRAMEAEAAHLDEKQAHNLTQAEWQTTRDNERMAEAERGAEKLRADKHASDLAAAYEHAKDLSAEIAELKQELANRDAESVELTSMIDASHETCNRYARQEAGLKDKLKLANVASQQWRETATDIAQHRQLAEEQRDSARTYLARSQTDLASERAKVRELSGRLAEMEQHAPGIRDAALVEADLALSRADACEKGRYRAAVLALQSRPSPVYVTKERCAELVKAAREAVLDETMQARMPALVDRTMERLEAIKRGRDIGLNDAAAYMQSCGDHDLARTLRGLIKDPSNIPACECRDHHAMEKLRSIEIFFGSARKGNWYALCPPGLTQYDPDPAEAILTAAGKQADSDGGE